MKINNIPFKTNDNENAANHNIYQSPGPLSDTFLYNSLENKLNLHVLNSINPINLSDESKENFNEKTEQEKISDYIFLKKKLNRNDVAKIKTEYLDDSRKLKLNGRSKKNKRTKANRKAQNGNKGNLEAYSKSDKIKEGNHFN